MIHPEDQRIMKIMEVLEQTGLFTEDELALAEDYLSGNAEQRELDKLAFRDLSDIPSDAMQKCNTIFKESVSRGRFEEGKRLAHILFAAGQSTCMKMLPVESFSDKSYDFFSSEPEKGVAVFAPKVAQTQYTLSRQAISDLIKMAENDPENIKKALTYQKDRSMRGKLILFGAYFVAKYPTVGTINTSGVNTEAFGRSEWMEGILAGVGKLFGKKSADTMSGISLEGQDALMMKEYEDILVNSLPLIYANQSVPAAWREIEEAINNDRVDDGILKMAETKSGVQQFMLYLIGSMSYINFSLSARLKNVVKVCVRVNTNAMLDIMLRMDLRNDMEERGGSFDEIFGIIPQKYIKWAAEKGRKGTLKAQYRHNRECFLEYMKEAEVDAYNVLNSVLKEEDPQLYKARMNTEVSGQQTKIINTFVGMADANACRDVRAYLEEGTSIETLYPYGDNLLNDDCWRGMRAFMNLLRSYQSGYGYDALGNKCEAMLMLCGQLARYSTIFGTYNNVKAADVKRLFSSVDSEKLSLKYQLNSYSDISVSYHIGSDGKKVYEDVSREVFRKYLTERREEVLAAIQEADSVGRNFGLKILSEDLAENKEEILKFAQDTAKSVKEDLLNILYQQKDWEQDIIAMLSSKKAADRDVAVRVLVKWDGEKYAPLFAEALEKEKNGKVRALLDNALNTDGRGQSGERNISQENLVKEIHKGNKKRTLAWAYETPFSKVRRKNGEEATEEYLQAILLCYSAMSPCGISPSAASLAEDVDEEEFAVYVNELFDKWLEAGAESKKRWVLYAAAIHGGTGIVERMHHQIQEWPQVSRGAIASEAVQALALNPTPQALLIVDGISRKFKFKQVKAAAGKALEFAASQLGITKEELADRIVPDLGFDENMERHFDYGERKFTVTITPVLEVEVFDESGKKLKNLPAPGKRDDEVKAAAAYEEFKQMKKQMKATVSSQKMRLDLALSTERRWSVAAWKDLFVKNPIMHQFAIGLIWGVYEGSDLVASFRYMEDGSFNTEDEDEYELGISSIGLVHPIELTKESLEKWKQQLEDYEIVQPIEQLDRPVYRRTKEEECQRSLDRFGGCIVNDLSLGGKLMGEGWYRGSVLDAGGFYTFYREDPELSLGVELHFSGSFVGGGNEDVTVYEARFYKAGSIKRGGYGDYETNDRNSYLLKDVPERYFSEIVRQIAKAVSSSKDRNENWRKKRQ